MGRLFVIVLHVNRTPSHGTHDNQTLCSVGSPKGYPKVSSEEEEEGGADDDEDVDDVEEEEEDDEDEDDDEETMMKAMTMMRMTMGR